MCAMHNADDVLDWMVNTGLQAKLDSVMLTSPVKDNFFYWLKRGVPSGL